MGRYERACYEQADRVCKQMRDLEDLLALEIYGCSYEELDEDERGDLSYEVHERLGIVGG